ncbi:MAG: glutaminyl-peptide cyclotransferase [Flavobacteriaceae bacterium]|nr:glutaminyl-peptide cyclotransferase [Flavobacteriaceae bacterium]
MDDIILKISSKQQKPIQLGDTLRLEIIEKKQREMQPISYKIGAVSLPVLDKATVILTDCLLGKQTLEATFSDGKQRTTASVALEILSDRTPSLLKYEVLQTYPHDMNAYTQGLEFYKDTLYESTGQYGNSSLRSVNFETGEVWKKTELDKKYFAEGITILNDKIYQLTWQENTGFVYDVNTFSKIQNFDYHQSKEGWGLCSDGKKLYKSDGTEKIWMLDPATFQESGFIQVSTNTRMIESVNELEWVAGKIYANIYQRNAIAIINPKHGGVEAVIDLSALKEKVTQHDKLDVLNGIAYHPTRKTIFVTGKNWDKLFEIKILEE